MKNRNTQKSYGVRGSIVDPGPPWMTPNFGEFMPGENCCLLSVMGSKVKQLLSVLSTHR